MLCLTEAMMMAIGEAGIIVKIVIIKEVAMTMMVDRVENMATEMGIIEQRQHLYAKACL